MKTKEKEKHKKKKERLKSNFEMFTKFDFCILSWPLGTSDSSLSR